MRIILKSRDEVERLRRSNIIVAETLSKIQEIVKPGITTIEMNAVCERELKKRNAKPAFKGYKGYPFSLCVSVNDEVVHGMPSNRVLKDGDIVSLDCGALYGGFYGDSAITVSLGEISPEISRLIETTRLSLDKGLDAARVGNRLHDISAIIQETVESEGFSVVRAFVGHGIGRDLHEAPQVPNFGVRGKGNRLKAGMVLAIEPMVNAGSYDVEILADGWTAVTKDGSLSAHFEHSVAVTNDGPYVLSRL
jgi:methionyl aminopeptidase